MKTRTTKIKNTRILENLVDETEKNNHYKNNNQFILNT